MKIPTLLTDYFPLRYGGAPFLIPYFICLILVGMPILGMELSLGTFYQAGDADAFGSMNPRLRYSCSLKCLNLPADNVLNLLLGPRE